MSHKGTAILSGLKAIQGVQNIASGFEDLKEKKALRLEREKNEQSLDEWVDLKTRPFYMALKDNPEKQAFIDKIFASEISPQGLIQRRTIMSVFKSAMFNKKALDLLETDVIPADRRRLRKLFEKSQDILGKTSELDPEYIKIKKQYDDLDKSISIETGALAKHREAMELKDAQGDITEKDLFKNLDKFTAPSLQKFKVTGNFNDLERKPELTFQAKEKIKQKGRKELIELKASKKGKDTKEGRQWSNDARRALVTSMGGKIDAQGSFLFSAGTEQTGDIAMQLLGDYTDLSSNRAAISAKKEAERMLRELPDVGKSPDGTKARDKQTGLMFQIIDGEWIFIGK